MYTDLWTMMLDTTHLPLARVQDVILVGRIHLFVVADVGRGSRRRMFQVVLVVCIRRKIHTLLKTGKRTSWHALGPRLGLLVG